MQIRPITDLDIPAVLEVYRLCEDFLALGPDPHASPEMVDRDRELTRPEGGVYCGIFLEGVNKNLTGSGSNLSGSMGKLVGILDYIPNYNGDPGAAFIELLMIAGPYRGRGLGKAAVDWLLTQVLSGETAHQRLFAAVQTNNPAAIRFWRGLGFRITGPAAPQTDGTVTYPIQWET